MTPSHFAQVLTRTLALYLVWHSFQSAGFVWASWAFTNFQVKVMKPDEAAATLTLAKWMIAASVALPFIFSVLLWKFAPKIALWMTPTMSEVVIPFTSQTVQRLIIQIIGVVLIAYGVLALPNVVGSLLASKSAALSGKTGNDAEVAVIDFFVKMIVGAGLIFAAEKITRTFALWGQRLREVHQAKD